MQFTDFYGTRREITEEEGRPMMVHFPSTPVPTRWYAKLVGWRERHRMIYQPVLLDPQGNEILRQDIDIAFKNGATTPVSVGGRGVQTAKGLYELYALGTQIPIGPGSKILDGQAQGGDLLWISGSVNDLPFVSDISITGLYSSDIVPSPIFQLVAPGVEGPTNPLPPVSPPATPPADSSGIIQRLQLASSLVSGAISELSR